MDYSAARIATLVIAVVITSSTAVFSAAFADEAGVTPTEILVGASQPLSGEGAPAKPAKDTVYGVEAYFRKVNAEGGINGRKLKYIVRDNQYQRPLSLEVSKKLIDEDHVFAFLSPMGSPNMVATKTYINRIGIPTVGPIDGDSRSRTPTNPSIFYVRDTFEHEATRDLALIRSQYRTDEFAIYHPKNTLGETLTQQYKKAAHEAGMKILVVAEDGATPGDFKKALDDLRNSQAKVVVLAGNAISNAAFLKVAEDAGLKEKWIVNSPSVAPEFYDAAGHFTDSVVMSQVFPMDPAAFPFVKDYEAQMKKENHYNVPYVLEGYLNAAIFCEGIKRAGRELTRKSFIDAVNSMHDTSLGGVKISYKEDDHLGLKEIYFFQVTKEGYSPIAAPAAK